MAEPVVARPSRRRNAWILALMPLLAGVCVWAAADGEARAWRPWAGIALFGALGAYYARAVWRAEPWLVLDGEGVFGRGLKRKALSTSNVHGTQLLNVDPRSDVTLDAQRRGLRLFAGANKILLGAPISLTISRLDVREDELLARVRELAVARGVHVDF